MTRHIVLIGMMGVGKSTVGEALAARLGRSFVDVDRSVEAASGLTVAELFAARGEKAFRRLEGEALAAALAGDEPGVVATGGGALLDPANRALVAAHRVVWLRADADTLAQRVGAADDRPLLAEGGAVEGAVEARLRSLIQARQGSYAEVATEEIHVDALSTEDVVERILAAADAAGAAS